jgi:hypothetical protein
MRAAKATRDTWAKRVETWRESGETAETFAEHKGYQGSTLRWWSSRLKRDERPRFLRLVPKTSAARAEAELVVEIGRARVRVKSGFDGALLAEVIAALGGDR